MGRSSAPAQTGPGRAWALGSFWGFPWAENSNMSVLGIFAGLGKGLGAGKVQSRALCARFAGRELQHECD